MCSSDLEQALDAGGADVRADVYSLGCTLYCLLSGQPPFTGESDMEVIVAHLQQTPKALAEVRSDVPRPLSELVARMLAKAPADRPQSPAEVADAVAPFAQTPLSREIIEPSRIIDPSDAGRGPPQAVDGPTASRRRTWLRSAVVFASLVALTAVVSENLRRRSAWRFAAAASHDGAPDPRDAL